MRDLLFAAALRVELDHELKRHDFEDRRKVVFVGVGLLAVHEVLDVLEQLVLPRQLAVVFVVVHCLHEVLREAFIVYQLRDRGPSEVEVALLQVVGLDPDGLSDGTPSCEHSLHQGAVVARVDLVLQDLLGRLADLQFGLDHEVVANYYLLAWLAIAFLLNEVS